MEPYQFEPERGSSSDNDSDEESESEEEINTDEDRTLSTDWCARMCICCKELASLNGRTANIDCITEHQSFEAVCLNADVLWTALVSLHDRESSVLPPHGNVPNKSSRYAGYRQFTWWSHGFLGRHIRRVIPACVVSKLREQYPDPDGNYTGFHDSDDESVTNEVQAAWEF